VDLQFILLALEEERMYPRRLWSNASRCSMPTRSTTSSPSNAARGFHRGLLARTTPGL